MRAFHSRQFHESYPTSTLAIKYFRREASKNMVRVFSEPGLKLEINFKAKVLSSIFSVEEGFMTKMKKKVRFLWQKKLRAPQWCCEPYEEEETEEERQKRVKELRQKRDKEFKDKLEQKFREAYSPPDSNFPHASLDSSVFESGPGSATPRSPQNQFFPKSPYQVRKSFFPLDFYRLGKPALDRIRTRWFHHGTLFVT